MKNKSKKLTCIITEQDKEDSYSITQLQNVIRFGNLEDGEIAIYYDMISKQKTKMVEKIYRTAHPNAKEGLFYHLSDGRWKSKNPTFYAKSREELVEKLYKHFFVHTFHEVYLEWVDMRINHGIKSKKTIQEDISLLKNVFANEPIYNMPITDIKKKDIKYMYERWTGPGLITKKAFMNRKSALNGVFIYAAENEYIPINFITSIGTSELKFKEPKHQPKAFSIKDREKLLQYLRTLPQDGYTLAIQLALYTTLRIGEIRAIRPEDVEGNILSIRHQLVEESNYNVNSTHKTIQKEARYVNEKLPKGNTYYSIRDLTLIPEAVEIINKAKEINPKGEYLFMCYERPLNNDTFNERLRKYCSGAEVPYLSSHKLRFTVASTMCAAGIDIAFLQKSLGHSNRAMTEHYIYEPVKESVDMTEQLTQVLSVG